MRILLALLILCAPVYAADLPNPTLTPGAVDPTVTLDIICDPAHSTRERRHTTHMDRVRDFARYGIVWYKGIAKLYEDDHLLAIVLGGADVPENRWPQHWDGEWGAHVKDKLEVFMWRGVCAGRIPLAEAQQAMMTNWIDAYRKYVGDKVLPGWQGKTE